MDELRNYLSCKGVGGGEGVIDESFGVYEDTPSGLYRPKYGSDYGAMTGEHRF